MASTIALKAVGLNTQPNQLSLPEGSLTVASNIIIRRDNVIEPRRGFKLYGESFGTIDDRAKQLLSYKSLILRHYDSTLSFDDGSGDFTDFAGSYSEIVAGLRIKGLETNGNFYFTTIEGIKKISAKTISQLTGASGFITQAGGVKALDVQAFLNVTQGDISGFLPADSAVAYRIVWGIKDANGNLILGTPSQRAEVFNPLSQLNSTDINTVLHSIDNAAAYPVVPTLLNDTNYFSLLEVAYNSSGTEQQSSVLSLAAKLDADILYSNDTGAGAPLNLNTATSLIAGTTCSLIFSAGDPSLYVSPGSKIYLNNFTPTTGTLDGIQTVATVNATTITFTTTATGAVGTISGASSTVTSGEYQNITSTGSIDFPVALSLLTVDTPATHDQLATIQDTLSRIISQLKEEIALVINATALTTFIDPLAVTTSATVTLVFTIPDDITTSHFYQIYRSSIVTATGVTVLTDLSPSDELQLVYEAFPTTTEIAAQEITVVDVTPDQFRGANLYTNASTGEGILQANDVPPAAHDINKYKNYTFYANTRTRHRFPLNLLGVQQLINEFNAGRVPVITIANSTTSTSFKFVAGLQEITDVTTGTAASITAGTYFTLNSATDQRMYYFWYRKNTAGVFSGTDPALTGKIGVIVDILSTDVANTVATKTRDAINTVISDFTAVDSTLPKIRITNVNEGPCTDATAGTTTFTVTIVQQGRGEDDTTNSVLLSQQDSVALSVDATARSLVKVINRSTSSVYAYYLSGAADVPGRILLESRTLGTTENPFYVEANNTEVGSSFNPDISPLLQVNTGVSILKDTPTVGRVAFNLTAHGLLSGDRVIISGTIDATPSLSIDGVYTVTRETANQFSIAASIASNATITANMVGVSKLEDSNVSDNEVKPNRLYYSKFQQPEAVPLVNNIDLGAEDKEILRIIPLRNSLFVFKEDGVFRISGETAPFSTSLFDVSCILQAPDSLGIVNNVIFGWTRKGIENITEAGITTISRPIDIDILPLAASSYPNFDTATWGVGYESDNSYIVATVQQTTDEVATIEYRYSNLTRSWTTFDKTNTCGIVLFNDDKLYMGAGDTNYIEQERKNFDRTDYADRETTKALVSDSITSNGYGLKFSTTTDIEVGDVLTQEQLLTVYEYNAILQKLDIDPGVNDTDYFSTLAAEAGDSMRLKIIALATKLDTDSGLVFTDYAARITGDGGSYSTTITGVSIANPTVITTSAAHGLYSITGPAEGRFITITGLDTNAVTNGTFEITRLSATTFSIPVNVISTLDVSGSFARLETDFRDIKSCYDIIVQHLNNDVGATFSNYSRIDTTTLQEVIVSAVNNVTKIVTVNLALDFVLGPLTLYKKIDSNFTYAPQTMGDPLGFKHLREATLMFENKAFTSATVSFNTDLLPAFVDVDFNADSNGIFGHGIFFGSGFFGGSSNSAPFRTYIPATCQRCRYMVVAFDHGIAREKYSLFGATLTGEISLSSRAYK